MKTAFVFGPTSFIGSYFIDHLLASGYEVTVAVRKNSKHKSRLSRNLGRLTVIEYDGLDGMPVLPEKNYAFVFNFITDYGKRSDSTLSRMVQANVYFPMKVLEAVRCDCYVNIDTTLPNINFYAYTKSVCSTMLREYRSETAKVLNLKLERVYGDGDDDTKFLTHLVARLKSGETVDMTLGEQNIDFLHVRDCAKAILHLAEKTGLGGPGFEEFTIGSGRPVVLKELVEFIKAQLGSRSKINYGAVPYRKNEKMFSKAPFTDLKGWKPEISIFDVDFKKFS